MFALECTLHKSTLFFEHKPNDICSSIFSAYVGTLWEANTYAQFILDPYVDVIYCTFYLTKINKYMLHEKCNIYYINIKLNKLKHLNESKS